MPGASADAGLLIICQSVNDAIWAPRSLSVRLRLYRDSARKDTALLGVLGVRGALDEELAEFRQEISMLDKLLICQA